MTTDKLTQDELKNLLNYDEETGDFIWIKQTKYSQYLIGKKAGYLNDKGYISIKILNTMQYAHRLVWLYIYGFFPEHQIDHINGNRTDNRFSNLREATSMQNQQNRKNNDVKNSAGFFGVTRSGKKFQSRIQVDGKQLYLGTFDTAELASETYLKAKRELHPYGTI